MAAANARRTDPLRNFRFRVFFVDNNEGNKSGPSGPVALVSKLSGLKMTMESVELKEGGDSNVARKLIGRTKYEAVTLEQGLSLDSTFDEWVLAVNNFQGDSTQAKKIRRDIKIEVMDRSDKTILQYILYNCWPSEYQPLPDLDANANSVGIKTLRLENEGWTRQPPQA